MGKVPFPAIKSHNPDLFCSRKNVRINYFKAIIEAFAGVEATIFPCLGVLRSVLLI
jgi:hypothetical protein